MRHIYQHRRDKHGQLVFREAADDEDGEEKDMMDEYRELFYQQHRQQGLVDAQIDVLFAERMSKRTRQVPEPTASQYPWEE